MFTAGPVVENFSLTNDSGDTLFGERLLSTPVHSILCAFLKAFSTS